jgi:hypothetical protein
VRLIGLHGDAGHGKGEVARMIWLHQRRAGRFWHELAFADPLYAAVAAITGKPVAWLKDRRNKETVIEWIGKSPRQLLQLLGTEFGRGMIRSDIWIRRAMLDVDSFLAGAATECVVITDVRFDNEAEAIRERDGLIFEVVRPGFVCLEGDAAGHSSEAGISRHLVDATIVNSGTLAELGGKTGALLGDLIGRGRAGA